MTHECDKCGARFKDDLASAQACERRTPPAARLRVGDVVTADYGRGWFDGDPAWVANLDAIPRVKDKELCWVRDTVDVRRRLGACKHPGSNCFDACCTWGFYYVVVDVDEHEHRNRYHVRTLAMVRQNRGGWTYDRDHIFLKLVEDPPASVRKTIRKALKLGRVEGLL